MCSGNGNLRSYNQLAYNLLRVQILQNRKNHLQQKFLQLTSLRDRKKPCTVNHMYSNKLEQCFGETSVRS